MLNKIKEMSIIALLTAKGNNTLRNKNLLKINGKSILSFPCLEAKKISSIKSFFASSESKKILNEAKKYGYSPIKRPKYLSRKKSRHEDVLMHSVTFLNKNNIKFDIAVVLLGNAPLIKSKWIEDCINKITKDKTITSVVPVYLDNDHNPIRAKKITSGYLKNFFISKKKYSSNRQDLPGSYFLSHNFWVIRKNAIIKSDGDSPWSFLGKKVLPYVIEKTIDIHDKTDFYLLNTIIKKKLF
jgi:CMP-N-acetylneuraminic acid synthetase